MYYLGGSFLITAEKNLLDTLLNIAINQIFGFSQISVSTTWTDTIDFVHITLPNKDIDHTA